MKRFLALLMAAVMVSTTLMPTIASAQNKWIRIENHRAVFPITWVYLTPAGQPTWGTDQLGATTIPAGGSFTWTIPWAGCYIDAKAVTFTGLSAEQRNINVCGGFRWRLYD